MKYRCPASVDVWQIIWRQIRWYILYAIIFASFAVGAYSIAHGFGG